MNSSSLAQTPFKEQRSDTTKSATLVISNKEFSKTSIRLSKPAKDR